jgi:predicted ATPase
MIEAIEFKNFKVLRDAKLPLGRCTLLVGPNGSGKSTVLQALEALRDGNRGFFAELCTLGVETTTVEVILVSGDPHPGVRHVLTWKADGGLRGNRLPDGVEKCDPAVINEFVAGIRVFSLDARSLAAPARVTEKFELAQDGANLPAVLDGLRDVDPERFDAINQELGHWLPEFDGILFDRPGEGSKSIALRTRTGHHKVPATDLAQGVLIALAILTLSHLPEPPSLVCLEEPDRGIHPRLLRHVKDALYRLSYPESVGERREPVQVIATTHSPYFLDLFRDHPEEIVIANRVDDNVRFERLSDRGDIAEIIANSSLGEIWFSGILGGVPTTS